MLDQDIAEIAQILHHEWSYQATQLELVKKERDDGSPDWALMHGERLKNAQSKTVKAQALRDRFTAEFRETIMNQLGF